MLEHASTVREHMQSCCPGQIPGDHMMHHIFSTGFGNYYLKVRLCEHIEGEDGVPGVGQCAQLLTWQQPRAGTALPLMQG